MDARDIRLGSQLSALLHEEAAQARLPQRAWQEVATRLGEQERPGVFWQFRNLFSLPDWQLPNVSRFAVPTGAVAAVALAVTLFVVFSNPNADQPFTPGQSGTPTPQAEATSTVLAGATSTAQPGVTGTAQIGATPTAAPFPTATIPAVFPTSASRPQISQDAAKSIALSAFGNPDGTTTAVEGLDNMVVRLMRVKDLKVPPDSPLLVVFARGADTLIWAVQVEGTSQTIEGEEVTYRFHIVLVDAGTGEVVGRGQSEYEPFLLPLDFLPEGLAEVQEVADVDRNTLPVTRDQAVLIVTGQYGNTVYYNFDDVETALVRYSNPLTPGGSIGPTPTPTPAGVQPTPTSGPPQPTPTPRPTSEPIVDRLAWLVIMPGVMGEPNCFISGPMGQEARPLCWAADTLLVVVDVETGAVLSIERETPVGPRLTNDERAALQRFAWAEGWWALWHEVKQYNGERLPEGLAAQLDRPDAPTPTPRPLLPTVEPPSDSTPTPTPTPPPPPTPTSTSTPIPTPTWTPTPTPAQ